MRAAKIIVFSIVFVLIYTVLIQNQDVFMHKFSLSLNLQISQLGPRETWNFVMLGAAFLIGVIFAVVSGAMNTGTLKRDLKNSKKRVRELESQQISTAAPEPARQPSPFTPTPAPSPFGSPTSETDDEE
ncbi:MAG: LapA family protein [Thermodesulfobacteriota bacterium]